MSAIPHAAAEHLVSAAAPRAPGRAADCTQQVEVLRWSAASGTRPQSDTVAVELPIALSYNGEPHAVLLGTPADLEDLAVGFSLSEGLLETAAEIRAIDVVGGRDGIEVQVRVPAGRLAAIRARERSLPSRSACGLCGVRALADAVRLPGLVTNSLVTTPAIVQRALERLIENQALNAVTHAVHAAAWVGLDGEIEAVREDVGRHNALDKMLGAVARAGMDPARGFVLVTSRASYEMVQKTATLKVGLLVAVSAPTSLAVRVAEDCGLTLVAFARPGRHTTYSHAWRLAAAA